MQRSGVTQEDQERWQRIGYAVPLLLLLIMPIILPFVRRAGPVIISLAALVALVCILRQPDLRSQRPRTNGLNLSFGCFFVWSALTLFWSPWVERGFFSLLAGLEIIVASAIVMSLPTRISQARIHVLMAAGLIVASTVILIDLRFGVPLLKYLNARPEPFRYNMVLVSLLPLSVAIIPINLGARWLALRIAALAVFALAIFSSESETAKVAFIFMLAAFLTAHILPKKLMWAVLLVVVLTAWIAAPWLSQTLVLGKSILGSLWESGHASERLAIWSGFGEMALAGLPWGWGIDASAAAQMTTFFKLASVETQKNVMWLHPHSIPLQIYVELGLPGVILGALISLFVLPSWQNLSKTIWAQRCAFTASVFTVSMISHGFWQTWWWVAIAVGVYALKAISAEEGV